VAAGGAEGGTGTGAGGAGVGGTEGAGVVRTACEFGAGGVVGTAAGAPDDGADPSTAAEVASAHARSTPSNAGPAIIAAPASKASDRLNGKRMVKAIRHPREIKGRTKFEHQHKAE
jgi:hypothetical protein